MPGKTDRVSEAKTEESGVQSYDDESDEDSYALQEKREALNHDS